jgi:hypothetical protein
MHETVHLSVDAVRPHGAMVRGVRITSELPTTSPELGNDLIEWVRGCARSNMHKNQAPGQQAPWRGCNVSYGICSKP